MHSPHPNAPGLALGIDETQIARLVDDFYTSIRADQLLGPIFEAHVEDWPAHLETLTAFWSSVTLITGRYKGAPFDAHLGIGRLEEGHFERWLELFDAALRRQCTPEQALLFRDRAHRIARNFQYGLAAAYAEGALP